MERMTGLFYCVVLLCLSGCLSTTVTAPGTKLPAKPGVCPLRKSVAGVCAEYCFNDSDCPNNEKCCSNGCGHQCTAPVTAKPGVCPLKKYDAKTCTMIRFVSCANDSDCPKKEKCCHNGCGLQCMAPVTAVKPGVCPRGNIEAAMCPLIRYVPCGDDSHCAKNEKCCYNGCGLGCTAPVTAVKPGACPRGKIEAAMCPLIRYVPCGDDSHCAKNEKCCYNGCGLGCTAPVTVNPGVCPLGGINPEMCPLIRFGQCVDDSDCANNQKCCNNGCGRQCVVTV